jgi:hypothetical protein
MNSLADVVTAAGAGFICWVFLRMIVPFAIPARAAPVVMAAITWGTLELPATARMALAAATGIVLANRLTLGMTLPPPWRWDGLPRWRAGDSGQESERAYRPDGGPGRRIPKL